MLANHLLYLVVFYLCWEMWVLEANELHEVLCAVPASPIESGYAGHQWSAVEDRYDVCRGVRGRYYKPIGAMILSEREKGVDAVRHTRRAVAFKEYLVHSWQSISALLKQYFRQDCTHSFVYNSTQQPAQS